MKPRKLSPNWILWLILGFVFIVYFLIFKDIPRIGDDFNYTSHFIDRVHSLKSLLKWPGQVYLSTNGRVIEMFNVVFFNILPQWVGALAVAAMMVALAWLMLRQSFGNAQHCFTGRMLMLGVIFLSFPWWDSFFLYVCHFNYVWAAVLLLIVTDIWFSHRQWRTSWLWLFLPLSVIAAWVHEQSGVAMSCGLLFYVLVDKRWRRLDKVHLWMLLGVCLGAFLAAASPGLWHRYFESRGQQPDDPYFVILLKSECYVLLLVILMLVEFFVARRRLVERMKGQWGFYVVTAIVSTVIGVKSGMIGRTGLFAQVMALIALARLAMDYKVRVPRWFGATVSFLIGLALVVHFAGYLHWSTVLSRESNAAIAAFKENPAEPVFMDVHSEEQVPWWVLNKAKGTVDPDDVWEMYLLYRWYGDSVNNFVVLPPEVRDIKSVPAYFPSGRVIENTSGSREVRKLSHDSIAVPYSWQGRELIYVTRRHWEPGARDYR